MTPQQLEDQYLIPLYKKREIALSHGQGSYMFDTDGNRYLDLTSQYGAACLGYAHPHFISQITEQISKLQSCHSSFYTEQRSRLAQKLTEVVNHDCTESAPLSRVFFSSTGTESVEAALKFARSTTGKTEVISCHRSYHGRTMGALSATGSPKYQIPFKPLIPGFVHVPFNDIDAVKESITPNTAAVIVEPIQGEGGIHPANPEYLQQLRTLCDENEILLILDEVQTGIGRTGAWCAFHHYNVQPDILCLSKALGNGIPLAATLVTEHISERIPPGTHGTTFGGNPLSCTAGLAVLQAIEQEHLLGHVTQLGHHITDSITNLNTPKIRAVRGMGCMIGVEMKEKVGKYLKPLQQSGFLVIPAGKLTLRILPPYIVRKAEFDAFLTIFSDLIS